MRSVCWLPWQGVVSDAQESIRLAVAQSLPGGRHIRLVSRIADQSAGQLTFEADRAMKKQLKASFCQALPLLRQRIDALPTCGTVRPALVDYTAALQSVLPEGGVAPFELGGGSGFDALADLEASALRCQQRGSQAVAPLARPAPLKYCLPFAARVERYRRQRQRHIDLEHDPTGNASHRKAAPALNKRWLTT